MKRPQSEPRTLRGYAYLKGNLVYAECIDLCILVARPTLDEAVRARNDAIVATLQVADEQGIVDEILKRKSPLRNRLRYYAAVIRSKVRPWRPGGSAGIRPQPVYCSASCATHA